MSLTSNSFNSFNWQDSNDCSGVPNAILTMPFINFTGVLANDNDFNTCKYATKNVPGDRCCRSNLAPSQTGIQWSSFGGSYNLAEFPKNAQTGKYCQIQLLNGDAIMANSFSSALFLNDGSCQQGFICDGVNNLLSIYMNATCIGQFEQYGFGPAPTSTSNEITWINNSSSIITSQILGNFTASSLQSIPASAATISYLFVDYFPENLYYPVNQSPIEIFGTICQVLAMLISFSSVIYYTYLGSRAFFVRRSGGEITGSAGGSTIYRLFFFSHLVWLIYEVVDMYSEYLITMDLNYFGWVLEIDSSFNYFAMLITVIINCYTMLTIVFKLTTLQKCLVYLTLILIHIGLAGGEYLTILRINGIVEWSNDYAAYYAVFMFIFDSLASLVCAVYIVRVCHPLISSSSSGGSSETESLLYSLKRALMEPKIGASFFIQLTLTLTYYLVFIFVHFTTVMGTERGDSSLQYGLLNLLLSLHAIVSSLNFDYFSGFLEKVKKESKTLSGGGGGGGGLDGLESGGSPVQSIGWTISKQGETQLNSQVYMNSGVRGSVSFFGRGGEGDNEVGLDEEGEGEGGFTGSTYVNDKRYPNFKMDDFSK